MSYLIDEYERIINCNEISTHSLWQKKIEKLVFYDMGSTSPIGAKKWVDVTHIRSPSSFYIRPCKYSEFLPALQIDIGRQATDLSKKGIILFKSRLQGWVRGNILKKKGKSYVIFAMDYGFTEESVQANDIHEICCNYVRRVPPLAIWCSLDQCQPRGNKWSDDAINTFKEHVDMLPCHVIIHETSCSRIQYVEFILPTQIAKVLAIFEMATIVAGSNLLDVMERSYTKHLYYRHPKLIKGRSYYVIFLHEVNESTFFVSIVKEYEKFCKRKEAFLKFANTLPVLDFHRLKIKLPVCYVTNNEANHAIVESIDRSTKKATLRIMDNGTIVEIEDSTLNDTVRELDEGYLKLVRAKVTALYCRSYINIAVALVPGQQYKIKVYELGDKFLTPYKVTIDNVAHI